MDNPAIKALQKLIDEKKESYRHHLKTHSSLAERMKDETHTLQTLRKEIDALGETIQLILDAETTNKTIKKNAPASATSPITTGDTGIAINVIEGKDALKFLEAIL